MQYTLMTGAVIHDENDRGCEFSFGGMEYFILRNTYKIVDGALFIKQHVVKTNLRAKWRGETTDQWRTAHPVDESVLADLHRVKEIIQQIPLTDETKYKIADALRILEHGIGNAAEIHIAAERHRRDKTR